MKGGQCYYPVPDRKKKHQEGPGNFYHAGPDGPRRYQVGKEVPQGFYTRGWEGAQEKGKTK